MRNKLILQTQQRFKNEKHNLFTEVINKIALSSSDAIKKLKVFNQLIGQKHMNKEWAKI